MAQKQSPVAKTIDYTPLTQVISKAGIQLFLDTQGLTKKVKLMKAATMIIGAVIVLLILPTILPGGAKALVGVIIALVVVGVVLAIILLSEYGYKKAVRLWYFALANQFSYRHLLVNPTYTGMIFQQGYGRIASNIVYAPGSDTVASFEMDRQLPHMVLDSRSNNVRIFGKDITSNLPEVFSRDQILSLEGDFNKYFTLYAPKEYERDALYIFTPDLMALLMDQSSQFDAEIIDNNVYFYRKYTIDRTNSNIMYQLLTIVNTVGMKMYRQTDYYADERVADRAQNTVAQGGRRLKRSVNWFAVIIILIIFAVWIIPNFVRH